MHDIESTHAMLERIDRDGALRDAAADVAARDRDGTMTRRAGMFGGALGAAALAVGHAAPAKAAGLVTDNDAAILNFALVLEYLERDFYKEAVASNFDGELGVFAKVVFVHEDVHVGALKALLLRKAVKSPTFDFGTTTSDPAQFMKTAAALEGTGLAAYKGQAPLVNGYAVLYAALAIHSVEGRHYAWILDLMGENPAPDGLDQPLTKDEVIKVVADTGFVTSPLPI